MKSIIDLTNKKIIVTGASSGIGRATSVLLSQVGASVVLVGRNEGRLKETLDLMEDNHKHEYFVCDLSQLDGINQLIQSAVEYDGVKLDGLVHSAGITGPVPIQAISVKHIQDIMNINYCAFIFLVQQFIKKKYSNDGSSIVGISSTGAHYATKCLTVYAGSKLAVEAAVTTLAIELAPRSIRINTVIPGLTDTPMMKAGLSLIADVNADLIMTQLLPVVKPEDVSNMIAFLLSDASSSITGRHHFVDGGII